MSYKSNSSLLVLFSVLLTYAALIIFTCHYERLTGDATLYLGIAEKYAGGDFENAVNGYWGPLLSWLLIPFLYLGFSHVFSINALNLVFGLLTIIGFWKLSGKFDISPDLKNVLLLPLVPIMFFISLIEPMDFLLLCILVYYFNIVFEDSYPERVSRAVMSGVLGACAYFSKPYGFPFFISHFFLINMLHYFRNPSQERRKHVVRNALVGFLFFALLSGVWIGLISSKYNRFTFSNMGRGVFASLGPGSEHGTLEKGDPIFFEGFFEPPNETAFVIYEDPSYARKKTWNPMASRSSLQHYINNVSENIFEALRIYEAYSRLSITIVIAFILFVFVQRQKKILSRIDVLFPLVTIILYTAGYLPFHFETRYLWPVNILLLLMGGQVLTVLYRNEFFRMRSVKLLLTVFFVLSFIVTPLRSAFFIYSDSINRAMYMLGSELNDRYDIKGNIASNRQRVHTSPHDSWHYTFRLAYWLKCRYFGQPRADIRDEELEEELRKYGIDYYFYWGSEDIPRFLSGYDEITQNEIPGLKIYALNRKLS